MNSCHRSEGCAPRIGGRVASPTRLEGVHGIMDTLELDRQLKGMGAMSIKQVAVRRWKNGRVVHERFYHK